MFCPLARMPSPIAKTPNTTAVIRETFTCSSSVTSWLFITLAYTSWANEVDAVGQSGDNRQDRGEGDRGDDAEQDDAAELECQKRCGGVLPARRGQDAVRADDRAGAVPKCEREQIEGPDQTDRPHHRTPSFLGGRDGVETHQHMR